jgi:hypothetical protein
MDLRRLRLAASTAFFVQGLVFISLTTRLPDVKDEWDLSEPELSGLLLMMVLLAGVGSLAAERLAKRRDSATVLRVGLGIIAVTVPTLAAAPTFGLFVAGLGGYGVALGVVDASTNMQAVAVEHEYARPILPSFHGSWTLGGAIGAAIAIATAHLTWGGVAGDLPGRGPVRAVPPSRQRRHLDRRTARAAQGAAHARRGDGALLHGRHGFVDVGTDVPGRDVRDPRSAVAAGDVPVPARHPSHALRG